MPLKNITVEGACLNSSVSETNMSPTELNIAYSKATLSIDNNYTFRPPTRESNSIRKSSNSNNMPRGLSNADRYIEISKKRQRVLESML